jgi:hypothetical protein
MARGESRHLDWHLAVEWCLAGELGVSDATIRVT